MLLDSIISAHHSFAVFVHILIILARIQIYLQISSPQPTTIVFVVTIPSARSSLHVIQWAQLLVHASGFHHLGSPVLGLPKNINILNYILIISEYHDIIQCGHLVLMENYNTIQRPYLIVLFQGQFSGYMPSKYGILGHQHPNLVKIN